MSLPNYLAKIKSAGIYRFVWDKSQAPIQEAETLRLVVGYSDKGPFNTPVYIDNVADFKTIFGGVSKKLERKGIFFHRMALQALEAGPILALNLKKFSDEEVSYLGLNLEDKEFKVATTSLLDVYNTDRFWSLDPEVLQEINDTKFMTIAATDSKDSSCTLFLRRYKPTGYDVTVKSWYSNYPDVEIPSYFEGHEDMLLEDTFMEVYVFKGKFTPELAKTPELRKYFQFVTTQETDEEGNTITVETDTLVDINGQSPVLKSGLVNVFGDAVDTLEELAADKNSNFIQVYRGTTIPYFKDMNGSYISLDLLFNRDNNVHKMLMKLNEGLVDKENVLQMLIPNDSFTPSTKLPFGLGRELTDAELGEETPGTDGAADNYDLSRLPIYLEGYTYTTLDGKTEMALQNEILSVLSEYKGIRTALTNNIDVEYHYIVDTFRSYVAGPLKVQLSLLAKEKDNCLAILNYPFMADVVKKHSTFNTFDASKIKTDSWMSLPTANEGASWCAFYTSIVLTDGTVKTTCPSAAVVSNNFMEKYNSRQPYSIVAGPNYGLITATGLVGPDYNFSRADLDFFEPYGVNCLVYVPRVGTQINSNQTAKQSPVSALSKVHVRELVIFLQDEIASLLQSYQWEFNTQSLRDVVKAKADKLLENVQQNGGVYKFLNICDETNNTDDVINNEMLVLGTHIEPGMGAGKMVEELTIYRKGGMSSSAL